MLYIPDARHFFVCILSVCEIGNWKGVYLPSFYFDLRCQILGRADVDVARVVEFRASHLCIHAAGV